MSHKKKHAGAAAGRRNLVGGARDSTGSADQPASEDRKDQVAYPSVFFDDDLSAAPLYPPPLRRTLTRDLPRVELENPARGGPAYTTGRSTGSISSSDEVRIEHADPARMLPVASDDGELEHAGAERWSTYRSRADWVDEGAQAQGAYPFGDDDLTSSSSGAGYSADESPYSDEEDDDEEDRSSFEDDDADEPRPFPNPRLKNQHKYIRPPEHDLEYPPSPPGLHPPAASTTTDGATAPGGRTSKPDLLSGPVHAPPAPAAVNAYSAVPSLPASTLSHLSPYASPLISPTLSTTAHEVRVEAVPSALPSPTSEDALQYDAAAAAAYYAAQEDYYRSAAEDARGRNPHPRLLWRSVLDRDALEVLDAHHERVRGGPLPRLALPGSAGGGDGGVSERGLVSDPELRRVCLGASGLEREREHAGVGDDQMKERVRRARRRDPNRRTWSQAGRQWSHQMEQCGL